MTTGRTIGNGIGIATGPIFYTEGKVSQILGYFIGMTNYSNFLCIARWCYVINKQ